MKTELLTLQSLLNSAFNAFEHNKPGGFTFLCEAKRKLTALLKGEDSPKEFKNITLTPQQAAHLTIVLNCELRTLTGEASHPLNEVFRQLAGRDHDVYARFHPARVKPNEPWYTERP